MKKCIDYGKMNRITADGMECTEGFPNCQKWKRVHGKTLITIPY